MGDIKPPGLRILVSAGSFADAAAALRIVQQLPASFFAGLGGVLVEEGDIIATCQIPDKRIVLFSGTTVSAPNLSQLRTVLKADARAFQRSLARTAGPSGTSWVFAQDQGELVSTSLRAAAGWDVLILGYRQIHRVAGKIILLETSGRPSDDLATASWRLAQHSGADRLVFTVKSQAGAPARRPTENTIEFDTLGDALRVLTRTHAQAVLVDLRTGPVRNQADLSRLLEAARCPLIVFGASTFQTLLTHSIQIPPAPSDNGRAP